MNDQSMTDLFSQAGTVVEAVVITDRATGRSKGFGFVTFSSTEEAQKGVEMFHEQEVEGRTLVVNVARPKTAR